MAQRESEQSWKELLLDCKARGLSIDPKLAIGDGALGFWKAVRQVWPDDAGAALLGAQDGQRAGQAAQERSSPRPRGCCTRSTWRRARAEADKAFDLFVRTYEAKYPKATECLSKDRAELLAFYDFPAEHWLHLRTTNPIESDVRDGAAADRQDQGCGNADRRA